MMQCHTGDWHATNKRCLFGWKQKAAVRINMSMNDYSLSNAVRMQEIVKGLLQAAVESTGASLA